MRQPRRICRSQLLWAGALLAGLLTLPGCSVKKSLWQAGIPGLRTPAELSSVVERDGYLDAVMESEAVDLRLLFAADPPCRQLVKPRASVEYVQDSPLGTLVQGERKCPVVGIASLVEWRNRKPRPRGGSLIFRAQATFSAFYADEAVVLVRGRFPLAGLIGWSGGEDTVAMFPNVPECQDRLAEGVASMEYRPTGKVPLALVGAEGLCPILGLARPLGETPPAR